MRGLVPGLVGVVLAVGAAQAAGCPIDRATLEVSDPGYRLYGMSIERQDLIGARFRIVGHTTASKSVREKGFAEPTEMVKRALILTGDKGRFLVEESLVTHSSPAVTAVSRELDAQAPVLKGRKNLRQEAGAFGDSGLIDVSAGPLSSLQLKPVACN